MGLKKLRPPKDTPESLRWCLTAIEQDFERKGLTDFERDGLAREYNKIEERLIALVDGMNAIYEPLDVEKVAYYEYTLDTMEERVYSLLKNKADVQQAMLDSFFGENNE